MANYIVQKESLETVADSIRAKAGISEKLVFPDGWKAAVDGIKGGGGSVPFCAVSVKEGESYTAETVVNFGVGVSIAVEDIEQPGPETGGEIEYTVHTGWFFDGEGTANDRNCVVYSFPVKSGRTYTVTMTEIGNRLRCAQTTVDPDNIIGTSTAVSSYVDHTDKLAVGYEFTFTSTVNGWYLIYVSNQKERPVVVVKESTS